MAFPGLWGFMVWDVLHWMAEVLYVSPSLLAHWKKVVMSIVLTLPCPACKYHATIYMTTHKLSRVEHAKDARVYTLQLHNAVNRRINKSAWSLSMYLSKYQRIRNRSARLSAESMCLYLLLVAQSLPPTKDLHVDLKATLRAGWTSMLSIYKHVYPIHSSSLSAQIPYNRDTLTEYVVSLRRELGLKHHSRSRLEDEFRRTYFTTSKLKVTHSYLQRLQNSNGVVYVPRY